MRVLTFFMLAVIVGATLIANSGMGERVFVFLKYIPGGDTTGHFGLYAGLAYAFGAWGRRSVRLSRVWVWVIVAAAVVVSVEEFGQAFIATRTFSLLDLAASLAGLLVGSVVSAWPRPPTPHE